MAARKGDNAAQADYDQSTPNEAYIRSGYKLRRITGFSITSSRLHPISLTRFTYSSKTAMFQKMPSQFSLGEI
jgi:hypothetical protein